MKQCEAPAIRPQNFAVAASAGSGYRTGTYRFRTPITLRPHSPTTPTTPERREQLNRARLEAWRHWWTLFNEPDVWDVDEKRRRMLQARGAYHDAYAAWSLACETRVTAAAEDA